MNIPGSLVATVSGCVQAVFGPDKVADELNYQINCRMKQLYCEGYRRFRVVSMPVTGDAIRKKVLGWPE